MTDYQSCAERLTDSLDLTLQPVAVAFRDEAPEGVDAFGGTVPAGCSFWQEAAERTFHTSADDHALCAIGIHTHNLSGAPPSQPVELQASLEAMMGLDYVREEEVGEIPVMPRSARHVVYGPLARFPGDPDVVLLFADARQGLVLSETAARVDRGMPPAMGRPACAVVPQVVSQGRAALSLGCCGARANLDGLTDGVALWALPAAKLSEYCEQIAALGEANETLASFHGQRRKDGEAGERPTVRESLDRLS